MSELIQPNKEDRPTDSLNPVIEKDISSVNPLYTYQNSVEDCYAGDFRVYVMAMGKYLQTSKGQVYDPKKKLFIDIPVRYAAPDIAFSDNLMPNSTGVLPEASLQDRLALPLVSYYLSDVKRDDTRAIDRVVRTRYRPLKTTDPNDKYNRAIVTHAPIPMDMQFQVDVWTEHKEHYYQLLTCFLNDFNPYSYLMDINDIEDETQKLQYIPYVPMFLDSYSDSSNFIPGSDRRVVRGTLRITVKGWLTPPIYNKAYIHNVSSSIQGVD